MIAVVMIFCVVVFIATIAVAASGPPKVREGHPGDRERLLALEFRGVVVENQRVAHAFDAQYSCRVKIKCDDGANVTMTTSVFAEDRFRVGTRVVKRVGTTMPEPSMEPAPPVDAPPPADEVP